MKALRIALITLLLVLCSGAAHAAGWGAGVLLFDGEFGLHGRRTFHLGGDISELTTSANFIFEGSWFTFDADYHFIINPENPSRFYPLVGLDLATDFDNAELGINAGGGVDFMLTDTLAAYAEAKFVIGDFDGFVATLGVKF